MDIDLGRSVGYLSGFQPDLRRPDDFRSGCLPEALPFWESHLLPLLSMEKQVQMRRWLTEGVSVEDLFVSYQGEFECGPAMGLDFPKEFDSETPPVYHVDNHPVEPYLEDFVTTEVARMVSIGAAVL